jgi:hypothetical protein
MGMNTAFDGALPQSTSARPRMTGNLARAVRFACEYLASRSGKNPPLTIGGA